MKRKGHLVKKIFCEEGNTSEGEERFSLFSSDNYRRVVTVINDCSASTVRSGLVFSAQVAYCV